MSVTSKFQEPKFSICSLIVDNSRTKRYGVTVIFNSYYLDAGLCNSWEIAIFADSKDGCLERTKPDIFGGVKPSKLGFVELDALITIRTML